MVGSTGVTVMDLSMAGPTVRVALPLTIPVELLEVAVMLAVPGA